MAFAISQTAQPRLALPQGTTTAPPSGGTTTINPRTRLLLEGPITLLRLAPPNLVVNVILIAVTASIDAHFVGRLGAPALAGVSLVFPLMMLMQQIANSSMGSAIAASVARAVGASRRDDAAALAVHGLVIAAAMATLFSAALLIGGPWLYRALGGDGEILAAALAYSNAIFAGALAYWVLGALTSVVRGTGQPGVLAIVYIAAELLHIALVPMLVFGWGPVPPLGVAGAGIATVTSFTASAGALFWWLASGRTAVTLAFRGVRFERRLFVDILRVGLPMSLQPILVNVTLAVLTGFVGLLGVDALAGFGVAVRLEYVIYPLSFGFSAGMLAMVATNIGAGRLARAERSAWTAAALVAGIIGAIGLFALVWPTGWAALFSAVPEVQRDAAVYLTIAGLAFPCLSIGLVLGTAFQAAAQPLWPLLGAAARAVVVVGGGALVVYGTDDGLVGLAVAAAAGQLAYAAILVIAFRAGLWKRRDATAPRNPG
jgi:putative MATE family efflux protein